ncbi:hypothetical protein Z043_106853 [Scleropages formosus]|uniref:LIM zinc-binding domain-containing protein n=1 Tax=Scleropages formosus TaxID=113540 RepID=A0A0P7XCD4_SCLFO|nr:hypothetical protein Z043_106853 [Scleropages formosus]
MFSCSGTAVTGSLRREFPSSLGGSDTCHFCRRRVYVMERLSAEGLFFHRECLRCATCSCTLRLGSHAFDCAQGKFYCKVHFAQQKALTKQRRWTVEIRKEDLEARTPEDSGTTSPDGSVPHSAAGSPDSQPPGTSSSFLRRSLPRWPLRVTGALLEQPRHLSRRLCGAARVAGLHLWERAADYGFLFELLSLGLPLLWVLQEVAGQMLTEAGPLRQHRLLLWLERNLGAELL